MYGIFICRDKVELFRRMSEQFFLTDAFHGFSSILAITIHIPLPGAQIFRDCEIKIRRKVYFKLDAYYVHFLISFCSADSTIKYNYVVWLAS
jgi:hypothetical protein